MTGLPQRYLGRPAGAIAACIVAVSALAVTASPVLAYEDLHVPARIEKAMFGEHRAEGHEDRNRYRHPVGTLTFFGIEDGMTVMEIWPGRGWYTEILAPVMRNNGQFIVAGYDVDVPDQPEYRYSQQKDLEQKFKDHPELYDQVKIQRFSPPQSASLGEADSVDLLLTFRNAHGWVMNDMADEMFAEFFRVIRPGGTLGIVQHRTIDNANPESSATTGYLSEQAVIAMAGAAGFELDARSEVNANPKDSEQNYPEGVWTLPPSLQLGEQDKELYLSIGESDRMTLRFTKPD